MSEIVPRIKNQPSGLERNLFLDTLRGIAILGVVCVHFGGSFVTPNNAWSPSFYTGLALNQFFHFSVPLFVFISGLLGSPYRSQGSIGLGKYYFDRIITIGWPYLIASVAAFFLLGVRHEFTNLPTDAEKFNWLLSRFFYYGIHPTFYFIPMILLLYLFKPLLSWFARAIHLRIGQRSNSALSLRTAMLGILVVFLAVHVLLGVLAYRGVIDFYTWCRPNPLFWAVYFYFGLVFPELSKAVSSEKIKRGIGFCIVFVVMAFFADWRALADISVVGKNFESSKIDYAYSRPEILVFNIFCILLVAGLLIKGANKYSAILSYLGRHSLYIYLWHIFVLYFLAWRYESVLNAVKSAPELILGFSFFAALLIAMLVSSISYLLSLPGRYTVGLYLSKLNGS